MLKLRLALDTVSATLGPSPDPVYKYHVPALKLQPSVHTKVRCPKSSSYS